MTGNKKIVKKVLATFVEKNTHSQRNVAKNLDISRSSIQNILKNNGIMALHKIREQAMSVGHKMDRVKYDFSAIVRTHPRHNSKNNVVFAKDKEDVRSLLANKEQKFSPGVLLWSGISSKGMVPPLTPLFVDEVLGPWTNEDGSKVKNVNGVIYADMLESLDKPAVDKVYPKGDCIFQDDEAKIYRTADVLSTVDNFFNNT